jgi:cellulose synthase/poly-beta-1,6-N-acetylglucosamine synthase-like glycosyltransferase
VRSFLAPPPPGELPRRRKPPSFSVIIAAYQVADLVSDSVESALTQTLAPREVVVCDDGSTDDIAEALYPFRDRITLIRKENGGEASAKNVAARAASSEFVVILDADDTFLPERLEALSEFIQERPDLDILTTDAYLDLNGQTVRRCYAEGFRFVVDDQRSGILGNNFIFGHAAVRRDRLLSVGGFDESIQFATDWECWIRMILAGSRVGLVDEPLAHYRLRLGSLSSQRAHMFAGFIQTLEKTAGAPGLSSAEREVIEHSLARNQHRLLLAEAREALITGSPHARRRALAVVAGSGFGAGTRLKALVAAASPAIAGRVLAGREQETTGGVLLPMPSG